MRIYPSIERTFKLRPDGLYQEYYNHWVHFVDDNGNKTDKLDRTVLGKVFKEDTIHSSVNGEAVYTFESDGVTRRLIALSNNQQG